jgi:soluble lytic murein transglycosylase-like protein
VGALRGLAVAAALFCAGPAAAAPSVDRWSGYIAEASERFGVPETWIRRVMQAESGGRTELNGRPIESPAGAQGLMQLMPGTWRDMRLAHGLGPDPHDPHDNIIAGTAYLRVMYDRFGYPGLFAAYNAGPARYAGHLASGRRLPAETVAYVAAVGGPVSRPAPARASPPRATLFAVLAPPRPADEAAAPTSTASSLFVRLSPTSPSR